MKRIFLDLSKAFDTIDKIIYFYFVQSGALRIS